PTRCRRGYGRTDRRCDRKCRVPCPRCTHPRLAADARADHGGAPEGIAGGGWCRRHPKPFVNGAPLASASAYRAQRGPEDRNVMVRIDFNRLRFLVIDDNAHMRRILRTLLHGFGAREVYEAEDGAAGLEAFTHYIPDIVITDWAMPIFDGLELMQMIRQPG